MGIRKILSFFRKIKTRVCGVGRARSSVRRCEPLSTRDRASRFVMTDDDFTIIKRGKQ